MNLNDAQIEWEKFSEIKYAHLCASCEFYEVEGVEKCLKKREFLETLGIDKDLLRLTNYIDGTDKDQVCKFYK